MIYSLTHGCRHQRQGSGEFMSGYQGSGRLEQVRRGGVRPAISVYHSNMVRFFVRRLHTSSIRRVGSIQCWNIPFDVAVRSIVSPKANPTWNTGWLCVIREISLHLLCICCSVSSRHTRAVVSELAVAINFPLSLKTASVIGN